MRFMLLAFFLLTGLSANSQTILTIEGQTYTNSDDTWVGVNIPRAVPTALTFKNNSISSVNQNGYMLQAGDEGVAATNNNLTGEIITGNKFIWNGTDMKCITHGLFAGNNINAVIKYNYLDHVPMGIIRKSASNMSNTDGGVAYNIVKSGAVAINVKGMSNVYIYNNTLYTDRTTSETWRGLIDIYTNTDVSPISVSHGTKIFNNIFYTKYQTYCIQIDDAESLTGLESDYNIFYCESGTPLFDYCGSAKTFAQWQALGYDAHSVVINPNFIDFISFVPTVRLDYGTDIGSTWKDGLSINARWGTTDPAKTAQNGKWQVGAVIHAAPVEVVVPVPLYSGSIIANNTPAILEMTYDLTLASIVPVASAFSVKVNSIARSVSLVAISGSKVLLTLASPIVYGDIVTVAYTKPSSNPLQTASGGQAASLTVQAVTNNCFQQTNQPPAVNIASPAKSTSFFAPATITIDATASDTDGTIAKVEFYNGTAKLGEKATPPYSFTWKEVSEGTYLLTAVAIDNLNSQTISDPVTAVVEKAAPAINQLPVIKILSPENESSFAAPAVIMLTADASDSDGAVSKVEYFNGTSKIGESFSAPWSVYFECTKSGTHEITAVVTDNLNAASVSAAVKISVILKSQYPDFINLFPNPNAGQFSIDLSSPLPDADNTVIITNLSGNTVYYGVLEEEENTKEFDLFHTATGKYILIITSGNKIVATKKFIKN
jgi:uncharacterized repeat protein (TIGR02059 family)